MPASESGLLPGGNEASVGASGIVWLASYPKSGNTWTRAFLHNLLGLLEGKDIEHDINEINEFTTWDLAAKRYEPHLGKPVEGASRAEIAAARPKVQKEIAAQTAGMALVKTHHALVMDRGQPTLNFAVTSGAIYLVRNPLDVAISFAHHMNTDIDTAIDQMAVEDMETEVSEKSVYEVYGSWSQHVRSWTAKPHRAICVVRYEDMLERPFETFARLSRHLLLRPTPEQIDQAIDRSSFARLQAQEEARGFREKPDAAKRFFREGRAGQWRQQLSRRQIRRVVQAHAQQMQRFGYLEDELRHFTSM